MYYRQREAGYFFGFPVMYSAKPQFFYHVTSQKWADKIVLNPRTSSHKGVKERPDDEPKLARICVAKSVSGCLSAITAMLDRKPFYVFRTYRKVQVKYPWKVVDMTITQERWITRPCVFIKIGTLSKKKMTEIVQSEDFSDTTGSDWLSDLINQKFCLETLLRPKCTQWGFN